MEMILTIVAFIFCAYMVKINFDGDYFKAFKANGVRPVLVAPHRAAGNGQAERVVQFAKDSLRRIVRGSWRKRLSQMLLFQHITPSSVTGASPAELLMGRRLRSCLDRVHPDFSQGSSETSPERSVRTFQPDDPVYVRNYSTGPVWIPATVAKETGPVSYQATTGSGEVLRRHVDQMIKRSPIDLPNIERSIIEPSQEPSQVPPQLPSRVPPQQLPPPSPAPSRVLRPRDTLRPPDFFRP